MRKLTVLLIALIALEVRAGEWGSRGVSRRFLISGNILYAADGRGVSVYDIASELRRIDVESGDDETRDVALMGSTLGNTLVVATARGIDRFAVATNGTLTRGESARDIRDVTRIAANDELTAAAVGTDVILYDASLTRVRQLKFANQVRAVTFIGNLLYVGVTETAVFVVDPATAAQIADLPVDANDFARSGSTLWAASLSQGLVAIDITDPAAPQVLGRTGAGVYKLSAVAASGSRVYGIEAPDVVRIFDASNVADVKLASILRDWAHVLGAKDTRLFLAGTQVDLEGPTETGVPLRAYDTSNLASPRVAAQINDYAGPVSGAWTDGSIALIVDPPFLRTLDVSKSNQPRELASIVVPNIQERIRVRNGMAILYGRNHVNFIDVSNPANPKYLGSWYTQGHKFSAAAFLRDTIVEANEHSGLHIVDYSDPANARQIAGRIWHYHDLAAGDDAVYVMQLLSYITLDVSDRNRVVDREIRNVEGYTQIDTLPPNNGAPQYLAWLGLDHVLLFTLEHDRFHPQEIARIPIQSPQIFGTSANSIFVASDGALLRIDVTDRSRVLETGIRVVSPQQIAVFGEKVVIADRYSVRVFGPDTPPPPPPPMKRRASRH